MIHNFIHFGQANGRAFAQAPRAPARAHTPTRTGMGIAGYDCLICHGRRCARAANTNPAYPQDDQPEGSKCKPSCPGEQFCFERTTVFVPLRIVSAAPNAMLPVTLLGHYECEYDGYRVYATAPPNARGDDAGEDEAAPRFAPFLSGPVERLHDGSMLTSGGAVVPASAIAFLDCAPNTPELAEEERGRFKYLAVGDVYCASCWRLSAPPRAGDGAPRPFSLEPIVKSAEILAQEAAEVAYWQARWALGTVWERDYEKNMIPDVAAAALAAADKPGGAAAAEVARKLNQCWHRFVDGDLSTPAATSLALAALSELAVGKPGVRAVWCSSVGLWVQYSHMRDNDSSHLEFLEAALGALESPTTITLKCDYDANSSAPINVRTEPLTAAYRLEELNRLLYHAAEGGKPRAVERLLAAGASPFYVSGDVSLILSAVQREDNVADYSRVDVGPSRLAVLKALTSAGVDPAVPLPFHSGDPKSLIQLAVTVGCVDVLSWLATEKRLPTSGDDADSLLVSAVTCLRHGAVQVLLGARTADANPLTLLRTDKHWSRHWSTGGSSFNPDTLADGSLAKVPLLGAALFSAAYSTYSDATPSSNLVRNLIAAGVDVRANVWTEGKPSGALCIALDGRMCHLQLVRALIDGGADIGGRSLDVSGAWVPPPLSYTPLAIAITWQRWEAAELLVEQGAAVDTLPLVERDAWLSFLSRKRKRIAAGGPSATFGANEYALWLAVQDGKADVVSQLLASTSVDPTVDDQFAIRLAVEFGHVSVVTALLVDPRVDPSTDNQCAIKGAAEYGSTAVLSRLLADPRVDPTVDEQYAICYAAKGGHTDVVSLLLADPRVDPAADNQYAIGVAAQKGHTAVVSLLLADMRVDAAADNQYAICAASENGHAAVVARLLADPRVDPAADNQYAIRVAARNGHSDVVSLLLADPRVDASVIGGVIPSAVPPPVSGVGAWPSPPVANVALSDGAPRDGAPLGITDALSYLDTVRDQFTQEPLRYKKFLALMKLFKQGVIPREAVVKRVANLFRGYDNLILGFNAFLPTDSQIELRTGGVWYGGQEVL